MRTCVNKVKEMYERSRVNVKVEPRSIVEFYFVLFCFCFVVFSFFLRILRDSEN